MPLIQISDAELAFGHVPLLEHADLVIESGERVCLIGRNGTGKSTLLNVVYGSQALDSGVRRVEDGVRIARLAQEVPQALEQTLFDTVAAGLGDLSSLMSEYHRLSVAVSQGDSQGLNRLSEVQAELDRQDAWDASSRVEAVLSRLRLPAEDLMTSSSGGTRRRAMLGQALVAQPDLLLLDEPTNHLDIESIDALEEALLNFSGAVLFITHDRAFVDDLATRIVELDRGVLRSYPGSFAAYQKRKAAELEAEESAQRKFDKHLAQEEAWIREGIKARRTRNEGRVRRLQALRETRRQRLERAGSARMNLDAGGHSGKLVIEAENVSFGYADQLLIQDFSTTILRGDRVGIIGPNGSGKSTLLKLMLGELQPQTGRVRLGSQLNIAYFDQERMQLDPEKTVRDNVADGSDHILLGDKPRHVIGYLQDFLFAPARANSPVRTLSGGERNRLLLAKLFARPANLLVLDEPTNDLDMESLELLEELLMDFAGTLLLVSHDRAFLDKTITSTLVMQGQGRVGEFVGGYSDWRRQSAGRKSASDADADAGPGPTASTPQTKPSSQQSRQEPRRNGLRAGRLSYKEQRELEQLPGRIEEMETLQEQLSGETSSAEFYQQEQTLVAEKLQALADVTAALETAYERWEELESRSAGAES